VAGTDAETFGPFLSRRGAEVFSSELGAGGGSSTGAPPFFHLLERRILRLSRGGFR
jgi:hypothetical protein